tara:strand:+ start:339 stop:659 length:321 start_codon:yes stop_codon:yes gene_type:complete
MNCPFCVNGIVGIGPDAKPCKNCMTPKRFISSLDKAIRKASLDKKKKKEDGLRAVRLNLPDYPVLAAMEAEASKLNKKFIEMLYQTFDIKPFMDVSYNAIKNNGEI